MLFRSYFAFEQQIMEQFTIYEFVAIYKSETSFWQVCFICAPEDVDTFGDMFYEAALSVTLNAVA